MVVVGQLMTIGTFAKRTGLSVSAIRFYGGQGLLAPADVDDTTGYRMYSEAQVEDGLLIRDLRLLEMPLSDITVALGQAGSDRQALVESHLARLDAAVERAHDVARSMGTNPTKETTMSASLQALDVVAADVVDAGGGWCADGGVVAVMVVVVEPAVKASASFVL